jgi:hypothetical protein
MYLGRRSINTPFELTQADVGHSSLPAEKAANGGFGLMVNLGNETNTLGSGDTTPVTPEN